ncbi:MAG: hypothetical protein AB7F64_07830 [Gammaproteobacteria bacterium]
MTKSYKVVPIAFNIQLDVPALFFPDADNDDNTFDTLEKAQSYIKRIKNGSTLYNGFNNFPFAIVEYINGNGQLVYVEYADYCLKQYPISK